MAIREDRSDNKKWQDLTSFLPKSILQELKGTLLRSCFSKDMI